MAQRQGNSERTSRRRNTGGLLEVEFPIIGSQATVIARKRLGDMTFGECCS